RFIGRIDAAATPAVKEASPPAADLSSVIVGRDHALSLMHGWLEKMLEGQRQIVFVTGEAGIGKTTLLDAFVGAIAAARRVRVCTGQCLEQYGMSEAYLPVLEAVRQLCREDPAVVDVLRAHAPMWLAQMPSLVLPLDRETFGREVFGATPERMLREMGEALDV